MTRFNRFGVVFGLMSLAAFLTWSQVWGESGKKTRERPVDLDAGTASLAQDGEPGALASSKFASGRPVTYRTRDGDLLFALQVRPNVAAAPARPRDYLVMVDTSASQVGLPLANARLLVDAIAAKAGKDDRLSIWTINIPEATRDLTRGFRAPQSEAVKAAVKALRDEIPLGDTDLNKGIARAAATFEVDSGRQRVMVFLGDGMSIHNPLAPADRIRLCEDLVKNEIALFPVPLGPRLDPQNLHGMASGTGGRVIRVMPKDQVNDTVKRMQLALATPIVYPATFRFTDGGVAEFFPTRLPPLRSDTPTLVLGKIKDAAGLTYHVEGVAAGKEVKIDETNTLTAPELDNFFLVGMFEQWKGAKDQPALMQADRALAYAQEINQLARAELLAQAEQALGHDKLEAASRLFSQASELDPSDVEARGGLNVVERLRQGKLTKDQIRQEFTKRDGVGLLIDPGKGAKGVQMRKDRLDRLLARADEARPAAQAPQGEPAPGAADLLKEQRQRQQIEEQRVTRTVEDALREARRVLPTNPDDARDLLKRILAAVRDNFEIGDPVRGTLVSRLENSLRNVEVEGTRIARDQAERLRLLAVAQDRVAQRNATIAYDDRVQGRMRVFHSLMDQARYEEAYKQALAITQDAINQGAPVPVAVSAAHDVALTAEHLREERELVRERQERFLATMLQVEKSHVPFPDEPPIVYPPAATWREITRLRKERYESSGFSEEDPATAKKIHELQDALAKPVTFEFESGPLKDALGFLSERYGLPIIVDSEAFKNDLGNQDVENSPVKLAKIGGVSLATVLRLLLAQVQGTYIIRREFIEVTTGQRQAAEKVIRVYPVADLVIPIPNSVNQAAVNQSISNSILGFQLGLAQASIGGLAGGLGGALGLAGLGGLGGIGGLAGLGGLGGLGGGLAGIGGVAGLGGIAGAAGLGGNIGGIAGLTGAQPANLGVGGGGLSGFAGFGGQLGQFGNLGGQFGLQGGDQSRILIKLISEVVGTPRDWAPPGIFDKPQQGPAVGGSEEDVPAGDPNEAGALGYYPPSRALIIKGTSRIHTSLSGGVLSSRQQGAPPDTKQSALDKIRKDFFAKGGSGPDPLKKLQDAAAKGSSKPGTAGSAVAVAKKSPKDPADLDPRTIWQAALARGVKDPGLIIAVADYLVENGKFDHAAEFLKADLRLGIVARPWVYEALAIALKESKGSVEEIERAQLSAVDLEPQDAKGFLRASRALSDYKRFDRAVAFCRQASLLEPDAPEPYADAILYAELGKDTQGMEWAAGNLLSRDWPADSADLHERARDKLKTLTRTLQTENRSVEADHLVSATERMRQRDLVIRLSWQSEADLELEVKEPVGAVCSFQRRQTTGGGILVGNTLAEPNNETYAAAEAFPGKYEVTVRRIWGRPLGSKATLEIIKHQGTAQESRDRETITFDRSHTLTVALDSGRRKSLAQVPSYALRSASKPLARDIGTDVYNKMRALADPELAPDDSGTRGGVGSGSPAVEDVTGIRAPRADAFNQVTFQSSVASPLGRGMDLTAQAAISPDRRFVRLSLDPVFETVPRINGAPLVNNPLIPGGSQD